MLRSRLESTPETLQDLVLAAAERREDSWVLAARGRSFAAVYLGGFTAEMVLKYAALRAGGAPAGADVKSLFGPAKAYGKLHFPAVDPESFHSLPFWAEYLVQKRQEARRPLDAAEVGELRRCTGVVHAWWWVPMRYRVERVAESDVLTFLENVEWFWLRYDALWR